MSTRKNRLSVPTIYVLSKTKRQISQFFIREKSQNIAWACFRTGLNGLATVEAEGEVGAVKHVEPPTPRCKSNRKAMNRDWCNQKANAALKKKREINKYYK